MVILYTILNRGDLMYRRILKVILGAIILCSVYTTAYADGLSNDGKAMDNPYGTCNTPSSFKDVEYYDCAIPYELTPNDIGGYATKVLAYTTPDYNFVMSDETKKKKLGYYVNRYSDAESEGNGKGKGTYSYEEDTGMKILTCNGVKFYLTAVQGFFLGVEQKYYSYSPENRGQLIDVILKDGTIIHFIVGSVNADAHTNGGPKETSLWNVQYEYSDLKLKQYKNLYSAASGNQLEVFGKSDCTIKFAKKYNISKENPIAYYRVYHKKTSDNFEAVSEEAKNVAYGSSAIDTSSNGSSHVDSNGNEITPEKDLTGMPEPSKLSQMQEKVELSKRDNLSIGEQYAVSSVGEGIELNNKADALDLARRFVSFIGLCLLAYANVLFFAMWLDKINTFVDLSIVKLVTFGAIDYDPNNEDKRGKSRYTSSTKMIFAVVMLFLIGLLLISGSIFVGLSRFVYWFSQKFLL